MGCRNTFEFRREELGLLRQVPAAQVTDDGHLALTLTLTLTL